MSHDCELTEAELVAALKQGEREAFQQLVGAHHNTMLLVARAIIGEAFADEVVQDAWETIISAIHSFEGRSSLRSWLITIVSNRAKTRLKREKRFDSLDEDWQDPDERNFNDRGWLTRDPADWNLDTPEALLASEQLRDVILSCLEALPEKQRAVLTLYDIEGLDFEQICNILDISSSNVRVLLHRSRLNLRHAISEYHQSGN